MLISKRWFKTPFIKLNFYDLFTEQRNIMQRQSRGAKDVKRVCKDSPSQSTSKAIPSTLDVLDSNTTQDNQVHSESCVDSASTLISGSILDSNQVVLSGSEIRSGDCCQTGCINWYYLVFIVMIHCVIFIMLFSLCHFYCVIFIVSFSSYSILKVFFILE